MENNIENNIKKEFHSREITPNPALWQLLEAKLELQETKKKRNFFDLAYASIFVGLLVALGWYFKTSKEIKTSNFITKQKPVISKDKEKVQPYKKVLEEPVKLPKKAIAIQQKEKPVKPIKKNRLVAQNSIQQAALEQNILEKRSEITSFKEKSNTPIQKETIVVVTKSIYKKKQPISEQDIEQLLAQKVAELQEKDTIKKSINISTDYVLYALEKERNTPLKKKIIKTLIAGAQAVDNHISNN